MINPKYRYLLFAGGVSVFLLMQYVIYLKYEPVYDRSGAKFSVLNFVESINVWVFVLCLLSSLLLWLCLKTFPNKRMAYQR